MHVAQYQLTAGDVDACKAAVAGAKDSLDALQDVRSRPALHLRRTVLVASRPPCGVPVLQPVADRAARGCGSGCAVACQGRQAERAQAVTWEPLLAGAGRRPAGRRRRDGAGRSAQVDPSVSAVVHALRSLYFKHEKDFAEFYKSSLLYLAFISSDALPADVKMVPHPPPPAPACDLLPPPERAPGVSGGARIACLRIWAEPRRQSAPLACRPARALPACARGRSRRRARCPA